MTPRYKKHIFICINERNQNNPRGDCSRCGGKEIRTKFVQLINQYGLKGKIRANKTGCLDVCELGAVVVIYPNNICYARVTIEDIEEIFFVSILNDDIVNRLVANDKTWEELDSIRKSIK